ncbi:MAG: acyloxyacyl hydrolase [Bacteroidota bacterium]
MGLKPHYGFVVPHSRSLVDVGSAHPFGTEIEAGFHLLARPDHSLREPLSKAGVSLMHVNFDYPQVLGSSTSVIVFAEPFINYRGFVLLSLRVGLGASYVSKVYDENSNPANLFISSHLSILTHLDLYLSRYINKNWFIMAYAKYNHISNIGIKEPNKGLNFPVFGLGAGYTFDPVIFPDVSEQPAWHNLLTLTASLYGSMYKSEGSDAIKDGKPAIGAMILAGKRVSRLNGFSLGLEGHANYRRKQQMEQENLPVDYRELSFLAGHELILGDFVFSQHWGTYIYAPYYGTDYQDKHFFQRYSFTYGLTESFTMGMSIRAHGKTALNFNLLLSYEIWKKKKAEK